MSDHSPVQSPSPLTIFLQYKGETKKYVLPEGSTGLSLERLQRVFLEKFELNTGVDFSKIYIQHPATPVRYELEDVTDVKDFSVLELTVKVEQGKLLSFIPYSKH